MSEFLDLVVTFKIDRCVDSEIIRNSELVAFGIIQSWISAQVVFCQREGYWSAGAVSHIQRKIKTTAKLVIANKVYSMRLVIAARIIFSIVYCFRGMGTIRF